jgi:SAM-dependent methyltransferase
MIKDLFESPIEIKGNLIFRSDSSVASNQSQTNEVFSDKWKKVKEVVVDRSKNVERQRNWHLKLYGFDSFEKLTSFLSDRMVILDAGCGLGEKSEWLASMNPEAIVIGIDYSDSVELAAEKFADIPNLYFVRGDIADTGIKSGSVDYILCDQVIMHTESPEYTFDHLTSLLSAKGSFSCYVYKKKAVPRELLDTHFRSETHNLSHEQLWKFAEQVAELGKRLSEIDVEIDVPEIELLGVKAGKMPLQRFVHWNLMKCFWNPHLGEESSIANNFDWYSPSNAKTYTKEMFEEMIHKNNLLIDHFNEEDACFSGRFRKAQ